MKDSDVFLIGGVLVAAYLLSKKETPFVPDVVNSPQAVPMLINPQAEKFTVPTMPQLGLVVAPSGSYVQTVQGTVKAPVRVPLSSGGGGFQWSQSPAIQKIATKPGSVGAAIATVFTKTSPTINNAAALVATKANPASLGNALSMIFKKKEAWA